MRTETGNGDLLFPARCLDFDGFSLLRFFFTVEEEGAVDGVQPAIPAGLVVVTLEVVEDPCLPVEQIPLAPIIFVDHRYPDRVLPASAPVPIRSEMERIRERQKASRSG